MTNPLKKPYTLVSITESLAPTMRHYDKYDKYAPLNKNYTQGTRFHLLNAQIPSFLKSNISKALVVLSLTIFIFLYTLPRFSQLDNTDSSPSNQESPFNGYVGTLSSSICGLNTSVDARDFPPVEYGLMIDAGSTGSRIHVYRFNHCAGRTPAIEHEIFEQLSPGLSSNASNPILAAHSLAPLLDIALEAIPKLYHSCSSIQVKATAGLRLLGANVSNSILAETKKFISLNYPFPLLNSQHDKDDAVAIMDGSDEGVYAWVTVNSLLVSKPQSNSTGQTAAILDLGGASTQIVFSPQSDNIPSQYRTSMSFGGNQHVLYQHSYLGYGLKEALKSIQRSIIGQHSRNESSPIPHPCYHVDYAKSVDFQKLGLSAKIIGRPHPEECTNLVQNTLFPNLVTPSANVTVKVPECKLSPCAMQGEYHPDIPKESAIFAFSYFYDLLKPVLSVAHTFAETVPGDHHGQTDNPSHHSLLDDEMIRSSTTLNELQLIQQLACYDPNEIDQNSALAAYPIRGIISDLVHEDPEYCASITYITQLLKSYRVYDSRLVTVVKKIQGYELGWCLGATMSMLDTADRVGKRCRIS